MNLRITAHHQARHAYIYIRQSTPSQVEFNKESTERQYALVEKAEVLGWDSTQIQVLDGDLGKSGQRSENRIDFHRLIAAVGLGEVGAVFALEASRLSRSQSDWHRLLELCTLSNTLLIDHDGVYDPNDFNDRMILGFKGSMSATELHAMKLRLQGAKIHKAQKGELRCTPPAGYVYDERRMLVFDYDESVVASLQLFFEQFKKLGSAYKVMRYFGQNNLLFPKRVWGSEQLKWGPLGHNRVINILHNPTYTGTYAYGKRKSQPIIENGQVIKVAKVKLPMEEWRVVLHDHHPAYLTWESYLDNRLQLKRNQTYTNTGKPKGIQRQGAALLTGLVICGRCGRKMTTRYSGDQGQRPYYVCNGYRFQGGRGEVCWSVYTPPIDKTLEKHLLTFLTEDQLSLSLEVLEHIIQEAQNLDKQWQLRLERTHYEAQRIERQYNAAEPENRLVVRTLEARWNKKLQELERLEQDYKKNREELRLSISQEERKQILELASDLPKLWKAPTTKKSERKEMLGLLVKKISLTPQEEPVRQTHIQILWHTNSITELWVARPSPKESITTPSQVIEAIREHITGRTDQQMADKLNALGYRSGLGRSFTKSSVSWIRFKYGISKFVITSQFAAKGEPREDGRYSTQALAKRFGVSINTIHYWRKKGVIPGIQEVSNGPWWHQITNEVLTELRLKIRRSKSTPNLEP